METKKLTTFEELVKINNENYCVETTLRYAEEIKANLVKPKKSSKPVLKQNANSAEVLEYAKVLEKWENENTNYNELLNQWYSDRKKLDEIVGEFMKQYSGLYKIPKQYQDKVFSKAAEYGEGYLELYYTLVDLLDIFE